MESGTWNFEGMDTMCVVCKSFPEDQEHILWNCVFAKKLWLKVLEWWDVHNQLQGHSTFNLWRWWNWFNDQSVKIGWGLVISAAMWTLWLNGNRGVFENKFYKIDKVMVLIKYRSYAWCQANSLVPELRTNVCDINPVGIISSHKGSVQKNLLDSAFGFVGFTDGSFVRVDSKTYVSSMGGYLKN